jgi:HpiC1 cyclase
MNPVRALLPILLFVSVATERTFASLIPIQNAGFETGNLTQVGNGTFSQLIAGSTIFAAGGTLSNWTASSTTINSTAGGFAPSAGGNNWTSTWWSGNNIGYLQISSAGSVSLSQTLADSLQNNTVYSLSALIGRRTFTPSLNYSLQLFAGSTLLTSASNLSLASNSFGTDTATYSSGSNNALAGQALTIVLQSVGTNNVFAEAFFDNISLNATSSATVPEPCTIALGAVGLSLIFLRRRLL